MKTCTIDSKWEYLFRTPILLSASQQPGMRLGQVPSYVATFF